MKILNLSVLEQNKMVEVVGPSTDPLFMRVKPYINSNLTAVVSTNFLPGSLDKVIKELE